MSTKEAAAVADYLMTVDRLEPNVSSVDRDGALTSLAISARRQADAYEKLAASIEVSAAQLNQTLESIDEHLKEVSRTLDSINTFQRNS